MTKKKQNQSKKIKTYTLIEKLAEQYGLSEEQIHDWLDYNPDRGDCLITQTGGEKVQLTKQQYQEFLEESKVIWMSKTLAKVLPLMQKFLYKWRNVFLKPPYDPADDKGSARNWKMFLIDLAKKEQVPLSIKIDDYPNTYLGIQQLISDLTKALPKKESKDDFQKIALISKYLKAKPYATSPEIAQATNINEAEVRRLWGPIKTSLRESKRYKPTVEEGIEYIDDSKECNICQTPISTSWQCAICKEVIVGECKECHYTNSHPEDAIP